MAKEIPFSDGVVVSSKFLNDVQQGLTGAIWGAILAPHATDLNKLAVSPSSHDNMTPLVMPNGNTTVDHEFLVGFKAGTQNTNAATGSAGTREIWASTSTALQTVTPGDFSVTVHEVGAHPSNAFRRKIGTATWNGTTTLSNVRLTNGIAADADQRNSFVFRTVVDSAADIPLTLAGRNGQNTSSSKMLSVGHDTTGTYGEKWSLASTGLVKTYPAASTNPHYQAYVGTDTQPQMSLLGSATGGVIQLGVGGATAVDVTIARSAVGVVKVTDTVDVINIQNSTASGAVAGAVNVLDALNLTGGLTFSGTALASTHLSDSAALARLASPTFTGTPVLPTGTTATTQAANDNSTKLATTAYADTGLALKANLASPTFTGTPTLPTGTIAVTQSAADNSTKVATTAYVDTGLALKSNLASPTFTGTPTLPTGTIAVTQAANDNTTKIATTAYVDAADALKANLASPTFTGTPTLPTGTVAVTQTGGDSSTKVATTAFVAAAVTAGVASDASTTVKGITKVSVAPASAANPIAVGDNDPRVTADQAAGTASIRTLGTGAQQAAVGNHTHAFSAITGTITAGQYGATSIVNADISASAAIAYSKLALTGAILNADLAGSIAYSKLSLTGAILNADLAGSIAYSKLILTGAVTNADLAGSIAYGKLALTNSVVNADIGAAAAIAYSKLNLSNSIVNADIGAAAAIAYSKLNLTGSVTNADLAGSIAYSKLILTGAVTNADLAGSIAYSKLSLTGAIVNADLAGSIAYSKLSSPVASFNMGGQKFTNMAAGTTNGDSVRYDELTSGLALKANLAGPSFAGNVGMVGYIDSVQSASSNVVLRTTVTADSFARYSVLASGSTSWGAGTTTADVVLSRSAAGTLLLGYTGAATRAAIQVADAPVAGNDLVNKTYADLKAPIAGPTFTGIVTLSDTGASGSIRLGGDSLANLYRDAPNHVKTDGNFIAALGMTSFDDVYAVGAAATNGSSSNSPTIVLQGYYDADSGAGTTSTAHNMSMQNVVSYSGGSGSGVLTFRNTAYTTLMGLSSAGQLTLPITGTTGGIVVGGDVLLYRKAADVLGVKDDLFVTKDSGNAELTVDALAASSATLTLASAGAAKWQVGREATTHNLNFYDNVKAGNALVMASNGNMTFTPQGDIVMTPVGGDITLTGALGLTGAFQGSSTIATSGGAGNKAALALSSTTADTGITIGGDTNLYRASANNLQTDDTLTALGGIYATSGTAATNGSAASSPLIVLRGYYDSDSGAGTTSTAYDMRLQNVPTYNAAAGSGSLVVSNNAGTSVAKISSAGQLDLPVSGSSAGIIFAGEATTNLYRASASVIRTNGSVQIDNLLYIGGTNDHLSAPVSGTIVADSSFTVEDTLSYGARKYTATGNITSGLTITLVSTDYDDIVGVSTTGTGFYGMLQLPTPAVGKVYTVVDVSGNVANRNVHVLVPSGHTLNGVTDDYLVLNIPRQSAVLVYIAASTWITI